MNREYVKTSVNFETALHECIENLVKDGHYNSRTELIEESLDMNLALRGLFPRKNQLTRNMLAQMWFLCGNLPCHECPIQNTCVKYLGESSFIAFIVDALNELSSIEKKEVGE